MFCTNFQSGSCDGIVNTSSGLRCKRDQRNVHQCAKCFSPEHGAHHPHECTRSALKAKALCRRPGKGKGPGGVGHLLSDDAAPGNGHVLLTRQALTRHA